MTKLLAQIFSIIVLFFSFTALSSTKRVVMISIDGYRHDYTDLYQPKFITKIRNEGSHAVSLKPSFPTLTFPNHYTLTTGLYPQNTGLVGNFFYNEDLSRHYKMNDDKEVTDAYWYAGTPLWLLAENQGLISATCFWVGSEAPIGGKLSTYVLPYDGLMSNQKRAEKVIEWLELPESRRPHLISLYFSDVDSKGHKFGPKSPEVEAAIQEIDKAIAFIYNFAKKSKESINIVIVSDHGMKQLETGKFINIGQYIDANKFLNSERGPMIMLYNKNTKEVDAAYSKLSKVKNIQVWKRNQVPAKFNFSNNERIGDLVVLANSPYYLTFETMAAEEDILKSKGGSHGWSNEDMDMHGIFYAWGDGINSGLSIPTTNNVDIYPFVANLLNLKITEKIDGRLTKVKALIKE